jgi:predicted Zn-dependent protease with MMP-like domain
MTKEDADVFVGQVMDALPDEIAAALAGVTVYAVDGREDPELKEAIRNAGLARASVLPDFRGLFLGTPANGTRDYEVTPTMADGSIVLNAPALATFDEVRTTFAHEIGHALGMSEEEVENLGLG